MNMLKGIGWAVIISLSVISCSEDVKPTPYEYTRIFTGQNSKTWRLTRMVGRKAGNEDVSFAINLCERDDQYTFYANEERLFEVKNGTVKCADDDDDPLLVSYIWEFNNAGASLSMVVPHIFGYFFIPFTVKSVTNDEMELEIFRNEEGTESYVLFFSKVGEN